MRPQEEIELIGVTYERNTMGDLVAKETPRSVLAEKQSVRQSEFYQAAQAGLRAEVVFIVWTAEYQGQQQLIHNGQRYKIIRTFDRKDWRTELVCTGPVMS